MGNDVSIRHERLIEAEIKSYDYCLMMMTSCFWRQIKLFNTFQGDIKDLPLLNAPSAQWKPKFIKPPYKIKVPSSLNRGTNLIVSPEEFETQWCEMFNLATAARKEAVLRCSGK